MKCSFGAGVSGRRPPSCVRGAPPILKGAAASVRTAGTTGSTPPATGAGAEGTAAGVKTPCGTACCTGGSEASMVKAAALGTCAAAAGASRSASTGSGSTPLSPCASGGAEAAPPTSRTFCRNTQSPLPSSCRRTAAVMLPPEPPVGRARKPPPRDVPPEWRTASWRDRTANTRRGR